MVAAKKICAPVRKKREREEKGELFTTLKNPLRLVCNYNPLPVMFPFIVILLCADGHR